MTDEQTTAPVNQQAPEGAPEGEPTQGDGENWQARMSGLQKAHNEETRVLREQVAALQAAAAQTTAQASQQTSTLSEEAQAYKRQADELAKALETERRTRVVETRAAKYPFAAETLGDPGVILAMDEAKMAGLNARLQPTASRNPLIDANGAARGGPTTERAVGTGTAEQLKADLAKFGPSWTQQVKEAMGG